MNIRSGDFVLEIGSGHNPKNRSDILCDKHIDDDTQRGGHIVVNRPTVEADGEHLPFAAGTFDYVICSHVLEHVVNPDQLIRELMRVASRGYIETPSEIAERLYGWPYHNWLVNLIDGRLVIQRKIRQDQFGQLFHALAAHDKHFARFHVTHHSLFLVRYEWEGRIDYEILPPDTSPLDLESSEMVEEILNEVNHTPPWRKWLAIIKRAVPRPVVATTKSALAGCRQTPKRNLQEIVVCPVCKGEVIWDTTEIRCGACDAVYPIKAGIPRLLPPSPVASG